MKPAPRKRGAKPGPRMPCGWCRKPLTAREIRAHFTVCPKRPKAPAAPPAQSLPS